MPDVAFLSGDMVRVCEPLAVSDDQPFRGCKKVRRTRDYDIYPPAIARGAGGIILGFALDNTRELFMVLINNERYIIWQNMMELVAPIGVAE